jgi:hypothetical protein
MKRKGGNMDKSRKKAWIIIAFLAYCIVMYAITFTEMAPEAGKMLGVGKGYEPRDYTVGYRTTGVLTYTKYEPIPNMFLLYLMVGGFVTGSLVWFNGRNESRRFSSQNTERRQRLAEELFSEDPHPIDDQIELNRKRRQKWLRKQLRD